MPMGKKKMYGKDSSGNLIPGKEAVGNMIVTHKGYSEGASGGGPLIGAKKMKGPGTKMKGSMKDK